MNVAIYDVVFQLISHDAMRFPYFQNPSVVSENDRLMISEI